MAHIEAGDHAPAFSATDQDGNAHTLDDHEGSHLVLFFYPQDGTTEAREVACSFRDAIGRLNAAGVTALGVSSGTAAAHRRFRDQYSLPFDLLVDEDHALMRAFGVEHGERAVRTTFLIGPDGTVANVYEEVDPITHVDDVLSDIGGVAVPLS